MMRKRETDSKGDNIRRHFDEFCRAYFERAYSAGDRPIMEFVENVRVSRDYVMYAPATHAEIRQWVKRTRNHEAVRVRSDGKHGGTNETVHPTKPTPLSCSYRSITRASKAADRGRSGISPGPKT